MENDDSGRRTREDHMLPVAVRSRGDDSKRTEAEASALPTFIEYVRRPGMNLSGPRAGGPFTKPEQLFHEGRLRAAIAHLVENIDAFHKLGVVHGDLRPANVRVMADGGLVIQTSTPAVPHGHLRLSTTTPYAAPEQVAGLPFGPAVDWYAVTHQRRRDDAGVGGRDRRRFRGGTDERATEDHG